MRVTFEPEGEAQRVWTFTAKSVKESRAELIENRYNKGSGEEPRRFAQWVEDVLEGGARARRVLVWHLLTVHEHPNLKFEDLDFARGDLRVEFDRDELEAVRANIEASKLPAADKAEALDAIDEQLAELGDEGKALSPSSESATA